MGSTEEEAELKRKLEELRRDVSKKLKFENAIAQIKSLLLLHYPSASPSLRQSFYEVICRAATVLKTRYTSPGFWLAGLTLFESAHALVSDSSEKSHLLSCICQANDFLTPPDDPSARSRPPTSGYLFEGHLTVDPEPPQPNWLLQSNLLNAAATLAAAESSSQPSEESAVSLIQSLMENLDDVLIPMMDNESTARRVPPASKEVVAKLPIITITEESLAKLGKDAECAICKENLGVKDEMQEMPCKHTFHPPCLKPWLDEHNSCPICRHELRTDDHDYESWKEREKEAEEERKGAANAVRGGEYMYV